MDVLDVEVGSMSWLDRIGSMSWWVIPVGGLIKPQSKGFRRASSLIRKI
jgi:hypothetical protein